MIEPWHRQALRNWSTTCELFLEKMDSEGGARSAPVMRVFIYNLSDPDGGLLYSVRRFVGLRLTEALPDETTILNFRHLLEWARVFEEINAHLASRGHRLRTGTIVDASIIDARRRRRTGAAHGTLSEQAVVFRDTLDAGSGLAHSWTTAANASDVTMLVAGLPGSGEASRAPPRHRVACGDEAGAAPAAGRGRRRRGGREAQGVGAGEG